MWAAASAPEAPETRTGEKEMKQKHGREMEIGKEDPASWSKSLKFALSGTFQFRSFSAGTSILLFAVYVMAMLFIHLVVELVENFIKHVFNSNHVL